MVTNHINFLPKAALLDNEMLKCELIGGTV